MILASLARDDDESFDAIDWKDSNDEEGEREKEVEPVSRLEDKFDGDPFRGGRVADGSDMARPVVVDASDAVDDDVNRDS